MGTTLRPPPSVGERRPPVSPPTGGAPPAAYVPAVRRVAVVLVAFGTVFAFLLVLAFGSVSIPLRQVVLVLLGERGADPTWRTIIVEFRLPKAITAALAGAALGVSGLQMQTLFRNPLADPYILGISSGASLGVALVVLTTGGVGGIALLGGLGSFGNLSVAAAAALGAGAVMALVLAIARRVRSTVTLLIVGLMVGYLAAAVVSLLVWSTAFERLRAYLAWSFGSFSGVTWPQLHVLAPAVAIGILLAVVTMKPLNAMLLGEDYAATMGVAVRRVRIATIVGASMLAGVVTAFCGPIAFVGVAVPHLARALFGTSDHRRLVPGCALLGATVALVAALVAALPGSERVLPINAVTSLLGAPTVVVVLLRSRHFSRLVAD